MSELFDKVFSYENLYKAHRIARLGKRHKKEVIEFELHLSKNLWELFYDLKYDRYVIGGYHKFMIYDPKKREIQAISYRDRLVQHCLCDNYLMPLLDRKLIYDNSACRKEKGVHFALKRISGFMTKHYKKYTDGGYFVKIDVKQYFASINHNVLKNKMKKLKIDDAIFNLISQIIDSYEHGDGKGLPMGNQTSQCFALFYLNDLDHYIKEKLRVRFYERYMDDMLLIVEDKTTATKCLSDIRAKLKAVLLEMNPKSQIIAVRNGINYLGWRLFFGENGKIVRAILKSSQKRIFEKLSIKRFQTSEERLQVLAAYNGHLKHGNAYKVFQKIKNILSRNLESQTAKESCLR